MARTWFTIKNATDAAEATVAIFDEIGMWGITAADFKREFSAITAPIVNVEINSPGGSVFDGIAIYNLLQASDKTINMKVMGVAASIASIILMAGDKITMPANAMQMVHSPSGGVFGTADDMREMADVLDKVKASLVGVYMKRTGKSEADVTAMLAKDTWMTAAEAKEAGFADEIIDAVEMTAKFDMDRIPEAARVAFKAVKKPTDTVVETPEQIAARVAAEADAADKAKPVPERIAAAAKAAGFEAHSAAWVVKYEKYDDAVARIAEAREIKAFCVAAKHADKADEYIKVGKTLAETRLAVVDLVAATDRHIDTSRRADPENKGKPVVYADVYAKRAAQLRGEAEKDQPTNKGRSANSTADIYARRTNR
jgi:ATP-dependent Clp protease, protease subunit